MSIFDRIRNAIFHRGGQASAGGSQAAGQSTGGAVNRSTQGGGTAGHATSQAQPTARTTPAAQPQTPRPATPAPTHPAGPSAATAAASAPAQPVDVEAVLEELAKEKGQKLNWRTSIVDLMKLLDLDSSLDARRELAQELGYTGSTSDSATMNVWLHRQVMRKLAENGGKVPAELRD